MELKPGYKQTELGVIPEEWEVKPLRGISPQQSVGLVINPSTYVDKAGTVPMLVGSNIGENKIDWASAKRITETSNQTLLASKLSAGDLVMVRVGEPGTAAVIPPEYDGCNCASMMIVRKDPLFDSEWLCFAMNSFLGRRQVASVQYGTAQKQFNISDAVDFRYSVPPQPEQRVIAEALCDMDGLLEGLDRLIVKKRGLKQAAMQQLLTGKKRLPGYEGKWEVAQVGEIATKVGSGITPTGGESVYKCDGRPFLRSQNIGWGTLLLDDVAFIDDAIHGTFAETEIKSGDVFLNITGASIGRSSVANSRVEGGNVNQHVCIIRADQGRLIPLFLNFVMLSALGQRQIDSFQAGGNRQGLNFAQVRSIRLPLPSLTEQTAIASVLSDMDAEIEALEQRRAKTRDLKQAMMRELLTGKTRLATPEAINA